MKTHVSFWRTWPGVCAILLLAALLFFLVTEHTAHFFGALPFAIFLLCPLMHFFMHKGHGGHGGHEGNAPAESKPATSAEGTHHH
jgi:hypothetical protein